MFVRKKPNKSGLVSVQVIDKSTGRYRVFKTIGSSKNNEEVDRMVIEAKRFIKEQTGLEELDFTDYKKAYTEMLNSIHTHRLVGVDYVLGKIFDQIGFNQIPDPLFRNLVLYRLIYPKSKLKTKQYLYRYGHKSYSEDDIYRYMGKLHASQKELVQQISYQHTLKLLGGNLQAVFYDVTTIYFEIEREDELRKTGFSKDGKHQHLQIVLGLLVSKNAYPLAYDLFEGNKYEGDTFWPILESFKKKYQFNKLEKQKEEVVQFLSTEFPRLLRQLSSGTRPAWGLMTPQHMVEHLIVTYKMSIGRIKIPVISAVEDHPRLKAYLMKDSPMRRSVPSPIGNNELQPLRSASLQEAVEKAIKETEHFLRFVEEQPDFMADHPYGGPMRADEWLFFHRKHIKHHFIQFNLIPDYE